MFIYMWVFEGACQIWKPSWIAAWSSQSTLNKLKPTKHKNTLKNMEKTTPPKQLLTSPHFEKTTKLSSHHQLRRQTNAEHLIPGDPPFRTWRRDNIQQLPAATAYRRCQNPIAAASLAQVYRAKLRETGQEVAVKVQRHPSEEWRVVKSGEGWDGVGWWRFWGWFLLVRSSYNFIHIFNKLLMF